MVVKSLVFLILIINASAFDNSLEFLTNNRSGKFLFDSLFGLEIEEELINAASSPNSLKSCDCGELRKREICRGEMKMKVRPTLLSI